MPGLDNTYPVKDFDHWCGAWEPRKQENADAERKIYCKECNKKIGDRVVISEGKSPWNSKYTCLECATKERKK